MRDLFIKFKSTVYLRDKQEDIGEVVSKRVVKTGVFRNQTLTNQKTHVLIKVKHSNEWVNEFEAENLEKIENEKTNNSPTTSTTTNA